MPHTPLSSMETLIANPNNTDKDFLSALQDMNKTEHTMLSLLEWIAYYGRTDFLDALMQTGMIEDVSNDLKHALLKHAIWGNQRVMVDYLHNRYHVDMKAKDSTGANALHHAARYGHTALAFHLLYHYQVDVNETSEEGTALCIAARNNHAELAGLLIRSGADVCIADQTHIIPLHIAIAQLSINTVHSILYTLKDLEPILHTSVHVAQYLRVKDSSGMHALQKALYMYEVQATEQQIEQTQTMINTLVAYGATITPREYRQLTSEQQLAYSNAWKLHIMNESSQKTMWTWPEITRSPLESQTNPKPEHYTSAGTMLEVSSDQHAFNERLSSRPNENNAKPTTRDSEAQSGRVEEQQRWVERIGSSFNVQETQQKGASSTASVEGKI